MPAISTLIAAAGVASAIGGTFLQQQQAAAAESAAKKQAKAAEQAARAKKPTDTTEADVKLAKRDDKLRRGKGSLAARNRASAIAGQSASSVGGL